MTGDAVALHAGWQFASTLPGACPDPSQLAGLAWREAEVPGTVASALGEAASGVEIDAHDWWFRTEFASSEAGPAWLRFEGLATLATVWLNGQPILESKNMFVPSRVPVSLAARNTLVIRFASLAAALAMKRPRPKWKTALVREQNLRWFRTTLLGRMPGWNPSLPPVGPWREIVLEQGPASGWQATLAPRLEGGRATVRVRVTGHGSTRPWEALRAIVGGQEHAIPLAAAALHEFDVADVPRWWPHTHGRPALVPWRIEGRVGQAWHAIASGAAGFREIRFDVGETGRGFEVNGVPIFCRGVCWSTLDLARLDGTVEALRVALERLRRMGANMVRVGGTMVYQRDDFYAACDELGLLVWQDFMFANFDYPVTDPGFADAIRQEAEQVTARLSAHACVAMYCGGSEVAQQAAMMGLPEPRWSNAWFSETLPAICEAAHPGTPYVPSTPWGGALPFHVGTGVAHYYGVGAYRRPFSDLRTSGLRFSAESLAFSGVPEPASVQSHFGSDAPPTHAPSWKAGVPRDTGAGWDFEDVRDHYLGVLYGVDAVALRSEDLERYHALSRRVPGEVMRRAYAEWRRAGSRCTGALLWLHRDVRPGAGWGITDVEGAPKAACWMLARAWAPQSVHLTDEGLDGVGVHLCNDSAFAVRGSLELVTLRHGKLAANAVRRDVEVPAHGSRSIAADELIGVFTDLTHAYRFGPPKQDVIAARWMGENGELIAEDFFFPLGQALVPQSGAGLRASIVRDGGAVATVLESDVFLQSVAIRMESGEPEDSYFHLLPGVRRRIALHGAGDSEVSVAVEALNLPHAVHLQG